MTLAKKYQHNSQLISALILKSKLTLLEGKFNDVSGYLDQASNIAQEKGLGRFRRQIESEKKIFESQIKKPKDLISQNATYYERIERLELKKYIGEAQKIFSNAYIEFGKNRVFNLKKEKYDYWSYDITGSSLNLF